LKTELEVWQTLDHRHVCKLYGSVREGKYLILFLEHAAGGELFERIIARETVFVEKEASRFMRQLLSAVSYLHDCGVIHRDLKPENLLLDSTADDASLRVADFGACKVCPHLQHSTPSAYASTPCGSLGYAAPEQMRQQLYERQCDLWSAGVIAYVLLSGACKSRPCPNPKKK
ncbi:kinase-like domain-containing protein, partial [Pavlovales sp. CCMP2436]